jgi:hypothetical protein
MNNFYKLKLNGWNQGIKTISLTKIIYENSDQKFSECKRIIDNILMDKEEAVIITKTNDIDQLIKSMYEFGIKEISIDK